MFKKGKTSFLDPPTLLENQRPCVNRIRVVGIELDFFCTNLVISARFNVSRGTKLMAADSF